MGGGKLTEKEKKKERNRKKESKKERKNERNGESSVLCAISKSLYPRYLDETLHDIVPHRPFE